MYGYAKKSSAVALRSAERRRREDDAPRLAAVLPGVHSLRIEVVEHLAVGTSRHVKLVRVERAPALFVIPCGDSDCYEGDHDITREVMNMLHSREGELRGESSCQGSVRSGYCHRRISYHVCVEYGPNALGAR
jgi:hypothetical protein